MVAGDGFMIGQGLHAKLLGFFHIPQIGIEHARPPAAQVGGLIIRSRGGSLLEFGDALHLHAWRSDAGRKPAR